MRVVDTSAWAEWIAASAAGEAINSALPRRDQWIVPSVVQLELIKWALRVLGHEEKDEIVAFSQKCVVVPLDTPIALSAAALCREHQLATADAIVYATALAHGADLLTCDAHFDGLPGVTYIAKQS